MTAERWTKVRGLVEAAMTLRPAERLAFLKSETSDDELVSEAMQLLVYDGEASAIFPIVGWQQKADAAATEAGLTGTLVGSYRILEELGRGGMGAVYLAERADGQYQHKVAIKILQENIFTPALTQRFRQERQILARLSHPGIARLLDGGVTPDGRPYLVLEYVDGQPIDRYCDGKHLDVTQRLRLFLQVAEGVQSAHQQMVLHLDLKPANILVTPAGEPRLLDFGIARMLTEGENGPGGTEQTMRLLTPRYASPEQAQGAALGVGSDVFSLATLLYRLLTDALPYPIEDASPLEAARLICGAAPVPPSDAVPLALQPKLRGDLDTILLQALRKEPDRRYPTVAAFAEDVERYLTSQPVLAHGDSFNYRAGKFIRRNRAAVIAAAAAVVILAASGAAVARSAIVAGRARSVAEGRLRDVRALAHSYVFDLDPMLEEIPGTVAVRHFVLQNAQKYLRALSQEAADDDDLSREAAQGYMRIGRVQESPGLASLSDWAGAQASMSKGVAIQRRLLEKHPADVKDRKLLFSQMHVWATLFTHNGDMILADQHERETWEVGQPLLIESPAQRVAELAAVAWDIAWIRCGNGDTWNFADPVAALPWLDRAQATADRQRISDSSEASRSAVGAISERVAISRAAVLIQLGRSAEARPLYEEALRLTTLNQSTLVEAEMRRLIRAYYASYLLSIHDVRGADALAPLLMDPGFHERGNDRSLTSDEADDTTLLARIDLANGRVASGRRRMEAGLGTLEGLYKSMPEDADVSSELAADTFRLAEEQHLDRTTRKHLYLRAIEIAEMYHAATHPQVLSAPLLTGKCELGLAELARDAHDKDAAKARATAALEQFSKVLAAHPVQPEASRLLARAYAISMN